MGDAAAVLVPEPGKVAIKDLDGSVSLIKQGDLAAAQDEGARPASEAEYFGAQAGRTGELASATVGAARGATFGLSDPIYVEGARLLGGDDNAEDVRHTLRLLKEANPNATLGGEIGGAVVPALFGGGAASAAEVGGTGLFGRAASRVAAVAPRAFGEGAAIGMGAQLSEDKLQNHKMTAESYLTAGVKGGAIGLLLAGGAAAGVGAAGDKLGTLFGRSEGAAVRAEAGAAEHFGGPYRSAEGAAVRAEEAGAKRGSLGWLEDTANEQRFKATGSNATDWKRLSADTEARGAEAQRIGKRLGEETFEGKRLVDLTASQEDIAKRIAGRTKEVAKSFRPLYAEADTAVARPSMSTIAERFNTEIRAPQVGKLYGDAELRGAEDAMARLEKHAGANPSHVDLWEHRKEIDGVLKKSYARDQNGVTPVGEESLKKLRAIVNEELLSSTERAGQELGGTLGDRIRLANSLYSDLSVANKAASRASQRMSGNQAVSITDVIAGAAGGLPGLVAMGANMVRRKYGNQIAAHVLDSATRMESVQRAATKFDALLNDGTKAFISNGKGASRAAKSVTTEEVRAIRDATRSPETVTARVADGLGDLTKYAPKVAAEAAATATRAAAWIQHTLPKEKPPTGPQFVQRAPTPMSDEDRLKAARIIETIEDPSVVLDRLRQGSLTEEHVATLKYVHPETYTKIQSYLNTHAAELKPTMTVQQQFTLSMLFGVPITEAMLPENKRAFQASFSQGNQAPGTGGAGGMVAPKMNAGPVNGGTGTATAFDKMEAGR